MKHYYIDYIKKIAMLSIVFIGMFLFASQSNAATYYIDLDAGDDAAAGTATGTAWRTLDKFTENARSAGDVAIVRRGTGGAVASSDLLFTSDGTISNPIIIEADYANAWSGDVDLSATGTATLTFGSKTVTFSADVSGVLSAGDWIYASGDAAKDFAYEVKTVSTTTVTLYIPYKGNQAGSGKTMYNMKAAPVWNTAAGNYQWNFDTDHYWKVQGIHIRGTDINGNVELDSSGGQVFKDVIFEGNTGNDYGIVMGDQDEALQILIYKSRFFSHNVHIFSMNTVLGSRFIHCKDSLFDGNNLSSSKGVATSKDRFIFEECEFKNHDHSDILFQFLTAPNMVNSNVVMRNCLLNSTTKISGSLPFYSNHFYTEDYQGTIGDNRIFGSGGSTNPVMQSETSIIRSGGGNTSIKITPSTDLSINWEWSKIPLFEYPIYADTTSKTYTIYFKTNATADWTADPTNSELWIEAEYWGHASNNHRRITKSTGVIDFNGSTAWQSLTVTVQPAQSGILYLRGWYAKTKETPSNIFYVDIAPDIS